MVRRLSALLLFAVLWSVTLPAEPRFHVCGYRWLTGHDCPFCGLTRALFALAKGHLTEALHFNLLSPLAFAMLLVLFWNRPIPGKVWSLTLAAFGVYGVARIFVPAV
jgi:hypothetical protein